MTIENDKEVIGIDYKIMHYALERLIVIIRKESEQIEKMKVIHLSEYAEEKKQLNDFLSGCRAHIVKYPKVLNSIPKEMRDRLRDLSQKFEDELKYHQKQLLKVRKVHSILMGMVKNSVKDKLSSGSGYTKKGEIDQVPANEINTPPVSLNSSF